MENENVMTVEAVTSVQKLKRKWLEKGSRLAKKAVLAATVVSSTATMCTTQAFAATGVVYHYSLHSTQICYLPYRRRCRCLGRCKPP